MYPSYMNQSAVGQSFPSGNYNPYLDRWNAMQSQQVQSYQIIHVNGENGARAFRMAPNSQCMLLDDTAPIVWLCVSDGAGYHTVTPYTITPYQAEPAPDYNSLNERLTRLEAVLNDKPDVADAKPSKRSKDAAE